MVFDNNGYVDVTELLKKFLAGILKGHAMGATGMTG